MKKSGVLLCQILLISLIFSACVKTEKGNQSFYVNNISGNDSNNGRSPETAWKSLKQASSHQFAAGEKLLLASGCTFYEKLEINSSGTPEKPILVGSYSPESGNNKKPVINAEGFTTAIHIKNSGNLKISNLELTADAGEAKEQEAQKVRYGILVEADSTGTFSNLQFEDLYIHDIFATENIEKDGQNPTSNMGYGIFIGMKKEGAVLSHVHIEGCKIAMTGHTGIRIFGHKASDTYLDSVTILNNEFENIGGPGMVPGMCENVVVRGNTVNYSGSNADPRMHNRGSGIWPWTCNNVLIEKNKFMNAWGKMDSYGCHIDYNCSNVVVQYNLSVNNAGGFVEILGNDKNCCYRYNISINDGYREKGVNGVVHDGKLLWTSGFVGKAPRTGPFNSYIYNNTIFVKEEYDTRFSFAPTTDGLLIANNIFYILGKSVDVKDHEVANPNGNSIQNVVFKNNLYQRVGIVPESVSVEDVQALFGDPKFKNPGSFNPEDYVPQNIDLIKDKGIKIEKLPGDDVGIKIGLEVETDFFGNPITGLPDLGAIEL